MASRALSKPQAAPVVTTWSLPETLEILAGVDREIVADVIASFASDTQERLQLLTAAARGKDWEAARAQAHAIKGASVEVGADVLAGVCLRIEVACKASGAAPVVELTGEASVAFRAVCGLMHESGWPAAE